jgi:hypothetical protein
MCDDMFDTVLTFSEVILYLYYSYDYIHGFIRTNIYVHIYTNTYIHVYKCIYTYVYVRIHTYGVMTCLIES